MQFICFRLLTEYYSFLFYESLEDLIEASGLVSVSLRSIIHSYSYNSKKDILKIVLSFRLLTEYYSFLFLKEAGVPYSDKIVYSFRLLTEYYSFLYISKFTDEDGEVFLFPSPYGVLFILI